MMGRAEPLIVDIFVAALAGVRLHEKLAGNFLSAVNLGGAGKERTVGTVAFSVHAGRRILRIFNPRAILPARVSQVPREAADQRQQCQAGNSSNQLRTQRRSSKSLSD